MDEKKRIKLLAGAFIGVVLLYWGRSGVDDLLFAPVRKAEQRKDGAEKDLETQQARQRTLRTIQNQLAEWRVMSLPNDALIAQRLYREWVENLAQQCSFGALSVEPATKSDQPGRYIEVAVEVKGETNLAGLSRFMYLFEKTNLVHRISDLKIKSTGSQGDPRLEVTMTCQGLSVEGAELRNEIFPRSALQSELAPAATEMSVQDLAGFPENLPKEPFTIRIDRELVRVTDLKDGKWTIQRAYDGSKAESHAGGAIVELRPEFYDRREDTPDRYAPLLAKSPFAAPSPPKKYSPRIAGLSKQTIKPGDEVRLTAKADDFNADLGTPVFTLLNAPDGMTIDEASGEISWKTNADLAPGDYKAEVVATQPESPDQKIQSALEIAVKLPNAVPQLKPVNAAVVVLGQAFTLKIDATDDGPLENLKWSLGSGAPEGLAIDAKTGELKWQPAATFRPGVYEAEVKATDSAAESKTGTVKVRFDVRDDSASLTLLTGAVSKDGTWYAWFRNKGTGENQQLKLGDQLKVDEIDAKIVRIDNRFVELSDSAGLWKLDLGNNLRQRRNLQPPAEATPVSVSTDPSKSP